MLRKLRGGASGPSGQSGPSGSVDLYYSIGGETAEGATGIILAAHSTNASAVTKTTPLKSSGWMVPTKNSATVFNRDQIKFPASFPTKVSGFSCSTWNGTTWTPQNFVTSGGKGFSLTDKTGKSLYTLTQKTIPTTIDLTNTVVVGLWDGLNFGSASSNKKTVPPAGTSILTPNTMVNVKISFTV